MGRKFAITTADLNDPDDVLYDGLDLAQRYLGHGKAAYGFLLLTPEYPNGFNYIFPLNPQSIEMDEEAAVTITPTQGGGKFIENQGSIFKDVVISGTTGFLPLANYRGKAGPSLFQQASARLLTGDNTIAAAANAKVSGYNEFHTLRTVFRKYLLVHRTGRAEEREKTSLYWINLKDNEVWLVEPMSFRMSRASRSPMTYNYNIRLRTLAKGSVAEIPADGSSLTPSALDAVRQTLVGVRNRIDAANDLLTASLGFFDQYRNLRSLVVSILDVGTDLSAQLTTVASGAADVLDLPRSVLYSATANISNVFEGIYNAADLVVSVPIDALEGLTSMRQQMDFVLASADLFAQKWTNQWNTAIENYNRTFGVKGDASAEIEEGTNRNSLVESTPTKGENIYQFAARVTGDARRAHEIIVLNNLKWPYIATSTEERAAGLVAPGDPVLVPVDFSSNSIDNFITTKQGTKDRTYKDEVDTASTTTVVKANTDQWKPDQWVGYTVEILSGAAAGQSRLITGNDETTLSVNPAWTVTPTGGELFRVYFKRVTVVPRAGITELLGVDLLINYNAIAKTWDLVKGSRGDLSIVRGEENLNQALTVKFITTQGELILHPWFGLKPVFGQRGTPEALFRLRLFFEQTLLSDSRIESIEHLVVLQERDMYKTEAKLAVKGGLRSRFSSPLV